MGAKIAKKPKVVEKAPAPAARPAAEPNKLARDTPLWIVVEDALPEVLELMTSEALAVCTDGDKRKGLYSAADKALALLVDDVETIQYHDDFNWETFGAVGNALKAIAPCEECLTVAVCAERDIWAVGIGMKGKSRFSAAKVALAASLAIRAMDEDIDVDLSDVPVIAEFVEEAKSAREA